MNTGTKHQAWRSVLVYDPCSYCGRPSGGIDHVDATGAGGADDWDNLTAVCLSCNSTKGARPLLTFLLADHTRGKTHWAGFTSLAGRDSLVRFPEVQISRTKSYYRRVRELKARGEWPPSEDVAA